ncbi:MAG TPA: hypothetical protein VM074_02215 [Solimonas sp.]|nr:hypothetical protein [Solimonas sp.]
MKTKLDSARSMFTLALFKAKAKATAIHVTLSLLIFGVLLYLMLVHWFPGIFFALDGGWQGVRIMLFVDVVLGPALTFLVYNPAKTRRALAVDFTFIGVVQLAAMIWGIHAVHSRRPLALVYNAAQFYTVRAEAYEQQHWPLENLRQYGDKAPVMIYAEPSTPEAAKKSLDRLFKEGLIEAQQPELYRRYDENLPAIFKDTSKVQEVTKGKPELEAELQALMQKLGGRAEDYYYYSFAGEYKTAWLVVDKKGEIVGTVDVQDF